MMKQTIIAKLNSGEKTPQELGFDRACDDGENQLYTRPCGRGVMQINCTDGNFDADVSGWYPD